MGKIFNGCYVQQNTQQYRNGGAQMHDRWSRKRTESGRTNSEDIVNRYRNCKAKEYQKVKKR